LRNLKRKTKKNNLLVINNKIISTDGYFLVRDFYKFLIDTRTTKSLTKANDNSIIISDYWFLGSDKDDNTYFEYGDGFCVFSQDGILLDSFKRVQKGINYQAISPNGDVYLWEVKPEAVYFYKIARRW